MLRDGNDIQEMISGNAVSGFDKSLGLCACVKGWSTVLLINV